MDNHLLKEARKYFPKIWAEGDKFKLNTRYGINTYSERGMRARIIIKKIEFVHERYIRKLATEWKSSNTTVSFYFRIKGVDYRLSNHGQKGFTGVYIPVYYDTDVMEIIFLLEQKTWSIKW